MVSIIREDFTDMENFGREREEWLRDFLGLPNGISDSDTFRRMFERIEPEELSNCLWDWLECSREERELVCIDIKQSLAANVREIKRTM